MPPGYSGDRGDCSAADLVEDCRLGAASITLAACLPFSYIQPLWDYILQLHTFTVHILPCHHHPTFTFCTHIYLPFLCAVYTFCTLVTAVVIRFTFSLPTQCLGSLLPPLHACLHLQPSHSFLHQLFCLLPLPHVRPACHHTYVTYHTGPAVTLPHTFPHALPLDTRWVRARTIAHFPRCHAPTLQALHVVTQRSACCYCYLRLYVHLLPPHTQFGTFCPPSGLRTPASHDFAHVTLPLPVAVPSAYLCLPFRSFILPPTFANRRMPSNGTPGR